MLATTRDVETTKEQIGDFGVSTPEELWSSSDAVNDRVATLRNACSSNSYQYHGYLMTLARSTEQEVRIAMRAAISKRAEINRAE